MENKRITFSLPALQALLDSDKSNVYCFKGCHRSTSLFPGDLENLKSFLNDHLSSRITSYDPELQGIIIAHRNVKIVDSLELNDDGNYIVDYIADILVFKPTKGSCLKGYVNKKSSDHIGVLVHSIFNATIPRPRNENDCPKTWPGSKLQIGQKVTFEVVKFNFLSKLPYIKGKLIGFEDKYNEDCDSGIGGHESTEEGSLGSQMKKTKKVDAYHSLDLSPSPQELVEYEEKDDVGSKEPVPHLNILKIKSSRKKKIKRDDKQTSQIEENLVNKTSQSYDVPASLVSGRSAQENFSDNDYSNSTTNSGRINKKQKHKLVVSDSNCGIENNRKAVEIENFVKVSSKTEMSLDSTMDKRHSKKKSSQGNNNTTIVKAEKHSNEISNCRRESVKSGFESTSNFESTINSLVDSEVDILFQNKKKDKKKNRSIDESIVKEGETIEEALHKGGDRKKEKKNQQMNIGSNAPSSDEMGFSAVGQLSPVPRRKKRKHSGSSNDPEHHNEIEGRGERKKRKNKSSLSSSINNCMPEISDKQEQGNRENSSVGGLGNISGGEDEVTSSNGLSIHFESDGSKRKKKKKRTVVFESEEGQEMPDEILTTLSGSLNTKKRKSLLTS